MLSQLETTYSKSSRRKWLSGLHISAIGHPAPIHNALNLRSRKGAIIHPHVIHVPAKPAAIRRILGRIVLGRSLVVPAANRHPVIRAAHPQEGNFRRRIVSLKVKRAVKVRVEIHRAASCRPSLGVMMPAGRRVAPRVVVKRTPKG